MIHMPHRTQIISMIPMNHMVAMIDTIHINQIIQLISLLGRPVGSAAGWLASKLAGMPASQQGKQLAS